MKNRTIMAKDSCEHSYLSPGGKNCSSNGVCEQGGCICGPGYSSINDFNLEPKDCDVNLNFAKFLWIMFLFLYVIALVVVVSHLFLLLFYSSSYRKNFKAHLFYYFVTTASCILFLTFGILKLSDINEGVQEHVVGLDPLTTFSFSFGVFFWWTSAFYFQRLFVQLFLIQLRQFNFAAPSEVPTFPFWSLVSWVFTFGVVFPALCIVDSKNYFIYGAIHHVGQGVLTAVAANFYHNKYTRTCIRQFQKTLDNRVSAHELRNNDVTIVEVLKSMIWKLKIERRMGNLLGISSAMLYGGFGIWPFLLRRSTYAISLGFGCAAIMIVLITITFGIELRKTAEKSSEAGKIKYFLWKLGGSGKPTGVTENSHEVAEENGIIIHEQNFVAQRPNFLRRFKEAVSSYDSLDLFWGAKGTNGRASSYKTTGPGGRSNWGVKKKVRIYQESPDSGFENSQDDTWPEDSLTANTNTEG